MESNCIGGGEAARPVDGTIRNEPDGSKSGVCFVCRQRLELDPDDGIPAHDLPNRD
jgi:hypothetical protein